MKLMQAEIDSLLNASREAEEGPTQLVRRIEAEVIERCAKLCEVQIDGYGDLSIYTDDVPWEAETMGQIRMARQCAEQIRT